MKTPNDTEIEYFADLIGYEEYIPFDLIRTIYENTIIKLNGFEMDNMFKTPEEKLVQELLAKLPVYDPNYYNGVLEYCLTIIMALNKTHNLTLLNRNKVKTKVNYYDNFRVEVDRRDFKENGELLDLDFNKAFDVMSKIKSVVKVVLPQKTEVRMRKYSEVIKIKKHNFVRPDFRVKFATKNFSIDSKREKSGKNEVTVIFFDGSISFKNSGSDLVLKMLLREYSNLDQTLYLYFGVANRMIEYKLATKEEKLKLYHSDIDYYIGDFQLKGFIDASNKIDKVEKNIVVVTDGEDALWLDGKLSGVKSLNIFSLKYRESYENLCKRSNGSLIIL